ncbi:MAG: DUF1569 domain-containing protein [Bacteroidota bacterium]
MIADFRKVDLDELKVHPSNKTPLWGSMTLQHMVEHLTDTFRIGNGTMTVEVLTPDDKVEKLKRIALFSDREFQQNFKSPILPPEPIPYRTANMDDAVNILKHEIEKFEQYYLNDKSKTENHPVFGALNYDEWEAYHNKHFTHHFKQFGLI